MTYNRYIEKLITNPANFPLFGFTIVRNAINNQQVKKLRQLIAESFDNFAPNERMLLPRHIIQIPDIYNLIFFPKIVSSLKATLGDNYVQWGDFEVQRNMFGNWHVDAGSENMAPYLFEKSYRFVKCGIYFQGNSEIFGGGIDIRWFSHKFLYNRLPPLIRLAGSFMYRNIAPLLRHRIRINAGDFVFFDSRILHKSTWPKGVKLEDLNKNNTYHLPLEHSKFTFYWNACNQDSMNDFMENSIRRSIMEEYIPKASEIYFTDYLMHCFPDDFPPDFVKKIKSNRITFATLDRERSNKFRSIYNDISLN